MKHITVNDLAEYVTAVLGEVRHWDYYHGCLGLGSVVMQTPIGHLCLVRTAGERYR